MGPFIAFTLARRIIGSERVKRWFRAARDGDGANGAADGDAIAAQDGSTLGTKLLQALVMFVGLAVVGWVTSLVAVRRLTIGDEDKDEFQLAVIMSGKEFQSHATRLRSATVITCLGGMSLDLREATLDPDGADLELRTMMGGIEVRVPPEWAVEVDQEVTAGALEVNVTSPEELDEDAPQLRVHAVTRVGGGLIGMRKGQA